MKSALNAFRLTITALMIVAIAACAAHRRPEIPLLPPATLGADIYATQQLRFTHNQQEQTLLAAITVDARHLRLLGLTPQGQRLINIDYDGSTVQSEQSSHLPFTVSARAVLQQLQLAYWPLPALTKHYRQPWSVLESHCQRQLRLEGKPFITVTYLSSIETDAVTAMPKAPCAPSLLPDIAVTHHALDSLLRVKTLSLQQGRPQP